MTLEYRCHPACLVQSVLEYPHGVRLNAFISNLTYTEALDGINTFLVTPEIPLGLPGPSPDLVDQIMVNFAPLVMSGGRVSS